VRNVGIITTASLSGSRNWRLGHCKNEL
jgi:hypothetical protein